MNGIFALLIHPDAAQQQRLGAVLSDAGLKVLAAGSDAEAAQRLGDFALFVPDLLVVPLVATGGGSVLESLRANPLTERVPVVVLTQGEDGERRQALRQGLTHLVPPPYDDEELILAVRLALRQHRDEKLLSGSLEQLSVPDLLQTLETTRRSGVVTMKSHGRTASLWLRAGRVIDAEIGDGESGRDAVFRLATWEEGTFEADFSAEVAVPERIRESTSFLVLEAMRRRDEAERSEQAPPHAAMPDPPPSPPPHILAIHRGLTLLNVAAAYATHHLEPALLAQRLEAVRAELVPEHKSLDLFQVDAHGRVSLVPEVLLQDVQTASLVAAVSAWLRIFFERMERALPGRFPVRKLRSLSEAVQEDLEQLGYYTALGLTSADEPSARDLG